MINRLALCVMMVGSLSLGVTANAVTENDGVDPTLELIEKAEELSEVFGEDVVIVDGYEVAVGEPVSVSVMGDMARNSINLQGSIQVSRPLIGGVMTANATSRTNRIVNRIGARARVNNNGSSISSSGWRYLSNTTLVTNSQRGTRRTGIAHGDHSARLASNTPETIFTTTNNSYR